MDGRQGLLANSLSALLERYFNPRFQELQKRRSNVANPRTGYGGNVNALSGVSPIGLPRRSPDAVRKAMQE